MSQATTHSELREKITLAYPGLSKQLQRIARFALENPHDLALGTIAAIAESTEVQPSAMIRFANALGFKGFSEMQQIFRNHLVARSEASSYRQRIDQMRRNQQQQSNGIQGVLHHLINESVGELGHLEERINPRDFKAAAQMLAEASQIHVLAQRRAFPVACYLAYALAQLELRIHLLDSVGGMVYESAQAIAPKEILLITSFRNYSKDVVDIAALCQKRGVRVIAITDSPLSPLKQVSSICLELGEDSAKPFRSLVGPLCVAQALVVAAGHFLAEYPNGRNEAATTKRRVR